MKGTLHHAYNWIGPDDLHDIEVIGTDNKHDGPIFSMFLTKDDLHEMLKAFEDEPSRAGYPDMDSAGGSDEMNKAWKEGH